MAAPNAPMTVQTAVELSQLGVPPACMAFTNVTMQSEKFVCVRETGTANSVVIVDLANPSNPMRRPITADSTITAPSSRTLALRAAVVGQDGKVTGDNMQVFNLDTKAKLKVHMNSEKVQFWTWLSDSTIALVTETSVSHWDLDGPDAPVKQFDRQPNLAGAQIISYRVSADGQWFTLVGIKPGSPEKPSLVKGCMQLYSVKQSKSQAIEAHTAAFSTLTIGGVETNVIIFTSKKFDGGVISSKIHCIALGGTHKKQADLFFPTEFSDDFPVALQVSEKYGLVYVVSKMGLLFVYDLENLTAVYRQRVSADPVFIAQGAPSSGGVLAINRRGSVLKIDVNQNTIVNFISSNLQNVDLAIKVAGRGNLPGADTLFTAKFDKQWNEGQHAQAAETAALSPNGILRTPAIISKLQTAPTVQGQKSPLLQYFSTIMRTGPLNEVESVEMAKIAVSQSRPELATNLYNQGKLTASEQLGDIFKDQVNDRDRARQIYEQCNARDRLTVIYAEEGNIQQLMATAGVKAGEQPNYMYLLQSLLMSNPEGALKLAISILKEPGPPLQPAVVLNEFVSRQLYKEATSFGLEALSADKEEHAAMQTKIIEINLMFNPEAAKSILENGVFSHYDRPRIAQLCEKAGLYLAALQHYTDITDIRRVMANTHALDPTALKQYFGTLSPEWGLDCLGDLVQNPQNVPLVVDIAAEYAQYMGSSEIVAVLERAGSHADVAVCSFLARRIPTSEDPEEHLRYVEAAAKSGQLNVVEQMTRESEFLPVDKTIGFLMDAKLPDARPLINMCDRFDKVVEMTRFLYENNMLRYIEGYVQKVNPSKAPMVVGGLLDAQASEDFIQSLIMSVRSLLPVAELCEEVEKRNRLRMLSAFLEMLVAEGSTDPNVHNAMGKILVDTNNNPEHFLQSNPYYEPAVVGKYCEKRDPHLACVAYKRGHCDQELIECTNRNSLFKLQARYLVERQDGDVYGLVLTNENEHRRAVIDQLVSTALPESKHPEMVSVCVKAFMKYDLQSELIELLEKIVLQASAFSSNANLQNLLIITAIKSDPTRVLDYIHRLEGFDAKAVANQAISFNQFDAAFEVFRKCGMPVEAVKVLLNNVDDIDRAHEYATKVDDPVVWSTLGHHQLERHLVTDAIGSYLLANDSSKYLQVIDMAKKTREYTELVRYLMMVRKKVKDQLIDTEIVVAYAMTNALGDLEAFITSPNQANLTGCGDRCFEMQSWEAARILYMYVKNYGRLASCLVHLKRFNDAVDAARKANNPHTWKEVCFACVDVAEFKLAQICALFIVSSIDDLNDVIEYYNVRGHFSQLITLLESGIGVERANMGIFTSLAEMYALHEPAKLMEHLKLFSTRVNIPRIIKVADQQSLWPELVFLYIKYDEYDNALSVMMAHDALAWEHVQFKDIAVKCSSVDIFYTAIQHYIDHHPELTVDLLKVLEGRIDHQRVVGILRVGGHLPLAKDYLLSVQKNNLPTVNEAVNELLIEESDHEGLLASVEHYDNYDQLKLADELEKHALISFRRIAALIYKRNLKWKKAVDLATKDGLYTDAMETAAQSGSADLVERLLNFFLQQKDQHSFAACLFTCQAFVDLPAALELAWVHHAELPGIMGLCMPFFVASIRDYTSKVDLLMQERAAALEAAEERAKMDQQAKMNQNSNMQIPLMLTSGATGGMPAAGYTGGPPPYGAPPTGYM